MFKPITDVDVKIGILGANGIVGAGVPIAVGAGFAIKYKGLDQVVLARFLEEAQITAQQAQIATQQAQLDALEARLAALEAGGGSPSSRVPLPPGWLLLGGFGLVAGVVVWRRSRGGR